MKILIDMNLSPEWVDVFAQYGIESVHWANVGDPRAADRLIMEYFCLYAEQIEKMF